MRTKAVVFLILLVGCSRPSGVVDAEGVTVPGVSYHPSPQLPAAGHANVIEIVEFFSYTCMHCRRFDRAIEAWQGSLPDDATFRRAHLTGGQADIGLLARAYTALEFHSALAGNHDRIFAAIHDDKEHFVTPEQLARVVSGIGTDDFVNTMDSNEVAAVVQANDVAFQAARLTRFPSLMVAGKYLVTLSHGPQQALDAVDSLVELERNLVMERAPTQGSTCAQSPRDPPPNDSPSDEPGQDRFSDELRGGGTGPPMVVIPGGRFLMGCRPENNHRCGPSQGPLHYVQIPPFAISKYEVTFEDYDRYLHATGGSGRSEEAGDEGWGRGNRPVINVLFEEAFAYIDWLSAQTGVQYRLPSESEWEYVARAGTDTAYSWGNEVGVNNANCLGCGSRWDNKTTAPVGSFDPNPWGVHDMHGNVTEIVQDCWFGDYRRAPRDGGAREAPWGVKMVRGRCFNRTVRGGDWQSHYLFIAASARGWSTLERFGNIIGFRVARSPPVLGHGTMPSGPPERRLEKRRQ